MRCAFMASDAVAVPAMRALWDRGLLACVVSNPDRPKGRGNRVSPNPAAAWALENGVPLLRPDASPSSECVSWMESHGTDLLMVMAYGRMLREEIINFPRLGCLNLHGSILPRLRGASPIETAVALGDRETGVTMMRVVKRMDAGDMCGTVRTPIGPRETGAGLRLKIALDAARLLTAMLPAIESRSLEFVPQDEAEATYSRKLSKADMFLDFRRGAVELDRRIRAFGAGLVPWEGGVLKVCGAFAEDGDPCGVPGAVVESGGALRIACGAGRLNVARLQAPCAREMPAAEFLKGRPVQTGTVLESADLPPLLKI